MVSPASPLVLSAELIGPDVQDWIAALPDHVSAITVELLQRPDVNATYSQPDWHAADGTPTWRRLVGTREPRPPAGAFL